ncbi:MAG: N-acetylmuramoyl-L-alanine amidase [Akkermansia sp.]
MPRFLLFLLLPLLLGGCVQQQMRAQVRHSRVVVLDIGHWYKPGAGGQGARTPDARYGALEECEFWYRYCLYTKRVIEAAGYEVRICNRAALPTDPALRRAAETAQVHQVNTPEPGAIYRSKHHPKRMAVGMLSADWALDQNPACVVFLHHNSNSERWQVYNKGAMYCNAEGAALAFALAAEIDRSIFKGSPPMENHGEPCGVILRNDGRRGGGDWLNTCNESYVPAVITEAAFLSNPEHARFLGSRQGAIRYAEAVGRGIVNYLNAR